MLFLLTLFVKSAFQDYQVAKSQKLSKVADLANADASEEDKLKAMMKQSGEDWEPSQYVRGRRPYAPGVPVPQNYVCYRCGKPGHFIRNCPTNGDNRFDVPKAKRTTGIPRTFLGTAEGTASPPGRSSPSIPEADSKTKGKEKDTANKKVPSELKCPACNNLLTDAVLIPCCGTSYCDDCIRNYLLENEQTCPSCRSENVSPDSLVINKQLRQAVNTFKNARPSSPYVTPLQKSVSVVSNDLQTAAKVASDRYPPESASSEKVVPDSKPAEHKVVKEVNETDSNTKESSPKPTEPLKPSTSQPQPIRVHHREASAQQAVGLKQGGASFDARRRQGEFLPRGQPMLSGVRHGLPEPVIPHGLPPEHIPRVPAVRPGISGPSHPGPRMNIPGYVPSIRTAVPAAIPRIPPVPSLVPGPLPHHPGFGAPVFDPLRPADGSLTPPMSEREFYKMQKKLKSRTKKKREHEHPSSACTSRESRPRKQLKKEPRKEPKKDGNVFDFDDELSEYRKLQKSRQRLRSRSLTPSRSWSHSPSRSRSFTRSRSPSHSPSRSSASPARSPTPEGWDESRSPSPASSRDQNASASAEDKKRKHKKRKKEQKSKERKKRKTSHGKEDESVKEQKDAPVADKNEEKSSDKKKHKRREKEKDDSKETVEDKGKGKDVGEEKDDKERKEKDKGKDKEGRKTKEKVKKKGNDKEKEKKSKEKKKKKGKDKKDESSSGKKRKSKKKHKKHKRHKKEKPKEEEVEGEEETSDGNVKESGKASKKFSTDEHETQESDDDETQHNDSDKKNKKSDEQESISEEENDNEKVKNVKEQEIMTEQKEASERTGKKPPHLQSDEDGNGKERSIDEENDFLTEKVEKELEKQKFEIGIGNGSDMKTRNGSVVKKHDQ